MELAARWGGYASHLCAAAELCWEIARQPSLPQVVVPRHRELPAHLAEAEVRRHAVTRADVRGLVTGPQLTVLLCARDLPFDEALTVADSCLRHGGVDHDTLVAAAAAWPEHARRVVAHADHRAANPFESMLRALAIRAGAQVIPQFEVRARAVWSSIPISSTPSAGSCWKPTPGGSMPRGTTTTGTVCATTP